MELEEEEEEEDDDEDEEEETEEKEEGEPEDEEEDLIVLSEVQLGFVAEEDARKSLLATGSGASLDVAKFALLP